LIDGRRVPLSQAVNFRDIGDYQTLDHRIVKKGLLYRSDHLSYFLKYNLWEKTDRTLFRRCFIAVGMAEDPATPYPADRQFFLPIA
jgi:hypothetical protein